MIVSPSVLSADFSNLEREIHFLNESKAQWIHLDVMDGIFVPNISFGFPVIKSIQKHARKLLDAHLMIMEPIKYVKNVADCGVEYMTVHYEACSDIYQTISCIKEAGMKVGVSIKPDTPVDVLNDIINDIDLVLVMSVYPGFSGQKFIEESVEKVKQIRKLIDAAGLQVIIEVDGGVNAETGKLLAEAGADALVAGNYVFKAENPNVAIDNLYNL